MKAISTVNSKIPFKALVNILLLLVVIATGVTIYSQWDSFVLSAVELQKSLHGMLAKHILAISKNTSEFGLALMALSFGYGVFHAVGPGHGKAVIVTYLSTHKESIAKGIIISFAAALLQSSIAIGLVSLLAGLLKFKFSEVHNYGNDVATVSYFLVMTLGLFLVVKAMTTILKSKKVFSQKTAYSEQPHQAKQEHHGHTHQHHDHNGHVHHHDSHHEHGSSCGCSHTHVPEKNESIWQTLAVIATMGARPCSGAIVVLIYAHLVGVYLYGIVATLLMGLGTGLSVGLIAVGAQFARSWLESMVAHGSGQSVFRKFNVSSYVRLVGGIVLILLGWSFYKAAMVISTSHPLFN